MPSDTVQRKLTTIFATDVVGYSQLMATDEESTLGTLQASRRVIDDLIAKHGGRIFNTAGDSVLAEFNSAVEAVRCAISVQEDLRIRNSELIEANQMWLRIGINVGDVMIEKEDLFGDGVNIAARLEALADKGGICISGSTFDLVKNKMSIAFEDIGVQSIKNIPDPVSAFKLVPGQISVESPGRATRYSRHFSSKSFPPLFIFAGTIVVIAAVGGIFISKGFIRSPFGVSQTHPFDGRWNVAVSSLSGCLNNGNRAYTIRVVEGKVDEPQYKFPKLGTISEAGRFDIKSIDGAGKIWNTQIGKMDGRSGKGSFLGIKPSCNGVVTLTLMDPEANKQ
jgi:class 3 adenylate cyclase